MGNAGQILARRDGSVLTTKCSYGNPTDGDAAYALQQVAPDGALQWRRPDYQGGGCLGTISDAAGNTYYFTADDLGAHIRSVDASGHLRWTSSTLANGIDRVNYGGPTLGADGNVYFPMYNGFGNGFLVGVDESTGAVVLNQSANFPLTASAYASGVVLIGGYGSIDYLNYDGTVKATYTVPDIEFDRLGLMPSISGGNGTIFLAGGGVAACGSTPTGAHFSVVKITPQGKAWEWSDPTSTGCEVGSATATPNGGVVVTEWTGGAASGYVIAFDGSGNLLWRKTLTPDAGGHLFASPLRADTNGVVAIPTLSQYTCAGDPNEQCMRLQVVFVDQNTGVSRLAALSATDEPYNDYWENPLAIAPDRVYVSSSPYPNHDPTHGDGLVALSAPGLGLDYQVALATGVGPLPPPPPKSPIALVPATDTVPLASGDQTAAGVKVSHRVVAEVSDPLTGKPLAKAKVLFSVSAGPDAGKSGTCDSSSCVTNSKGVVGFTYASGANPGTDTILATFDRNGNRRADPAEEQATASVTWTTPTLPLSVGSGHEYVALGDSYSSGEGLNSYESGTHDDKKNTCHRSSKGYPAIVLSHQSTTVDRTFRACSGAKIDDFYHKRGFDGVDFGDDGQLYAPEEPAQIVWLGPETKYVTLSVSGDDALFAPILTKCVYKRFTNFDSYTPSKAFLDACNDEIDAGFTAIARLSDRLAQLYRLILTRAPNAQVRVLDYPLIFPDPKDYTGYANKACNVALNNRALYMDAIVKRLRKLNMTVNSDIVAAVRAAHKSGPDSVRLQIVSLDTFFGDHTISCGDENRPAPWINGARIQFGTTASNASFHPNQTGQCEMAIAVNQSFGWKDTKLSCK
jgi:outer membrane protein assembly factor BamB